MPDDGTKTKAQLLDEVRELRERVGILEGLAAGRERAEEAPRESARSLKALVEGVQAGIVVHDASGRVVLSNQAAKSLIGPLIGEIDGRQLRDPKWRFFHEDGSEMSVQEYPVSRAIATKERIDDVVLGVRASGGDEVLWLLVTATPVIDENGHLSKVIGSFVEITERRRAEEGLRQSTAKLQAILDHSPALISTKDLDGNVTVANRRFEVLAGPAPEDFVGKNVYDLFPSDVADALWQNDLAAREGAVEAEETVTHRDGALHTYLTVKFPLTDDKGKLFGTGAVSTDITDRKQMEAERERLIVELREAIEQIKTLKGIVPICMYCKRIRDDKGYWHQVEVYVRDHTEAEFSHGICAECAKKALSEEDAEGVPGRTADD